MLVRLQSRHRITLPQRVLSEVETVDFFDVSVQNGRIVLTPVRMQSASEIVEELERQR